MKAPVKLFEEFVRSGIARKQTPDKSRAISLAKESERSYNVLMEIIEKTGIKEHNANYLIKNAYDIIMELIRAKMLLAGYNSSGQGAHEAEVSYLRELKFSESEIEFANQLRYFRNGITYYGKVFGADYAEKVIDFLKKISPRLKHEQLQDLLMNEEDSIPIEEAISKAKEKQIE